MNKKNIIVQKYGGSSVSNPQNIQKIAEAIIDRKAGGVVPYLPLPELSKKKGSDTQ